MKSTILCPALLICAALVLQAESALACGPRPTVLDNYERSQAVIIARVLSVEKVETEDNSEEPGPAKLVVEKVYKGNLRGSDHITVWADGQRGLLFDQNTIGHQFLVYLVGPNEDDNSWHPLGCGRTQSLEWATDDLLYLDNLARRRGKTRVSGLYLYWPNSKSDDVGNKEIRIIGEKKTYQTKTDANGVYEIYNLPPGNYLIKPEIPKGWQSAGYPHSVTGIPFTKAISPHPRSITLEAKKHVTVDLLFEPDNAIEGRVVGPDGTPVKGVYTYLWKAGDESEESESLIQTNEYGNFRIESIPPGSYVLVLNQEGISSTQPFPRLFYPGVTDREKATAIDVRIGETVKDLEIVVPKFAETITVSGVLLFSDGTPAADETVYFTAIEQKGIDGNNLDRTDSQGRFRLKLVKGVRGELNSEFTPGYEEYQKCPKLLELVRKTGEESNTIRSSSIPIDGTQRLENLVLKFPFEKCLTKQP